MQLKYKPELDNPPSYWQEDAPDFSEQEITEKAIELLKEDSLLLVNACEDLFDKTVKIAGYDDKKIHVWETEIIQGKHNKSIEYVQRSFLEAIALNSKGLREIANNKLLSDYLKFFCD